MPPSTAPRVVRSGALVVAALILAPDGAHALTLEEAVARAARDNPRVDAAEAAVREADAEVSASGLWRYDPELGLEWGARVRPEGGAVADLGIALAQRLELAGQRGLREEAARTELDAARARMKRTRRRLAADVHLAFLEALAARASLELARAEQEILAELHGLTERRLVEGAGTRLDVNVAAAELGRAELRTRDAEAGYVATRAALAEAVGAPAGSLPEVEGELDEGLDAPTPELEPLLESARTHRADLEALRDMEAAARTRAELARAQAWPDPTVRVFAKREDGREGIYGVGLEVPLPVFRRDRAEVGGEEARADRARADQTEARLGALREVVVAHARYRAGRAALDQLRGRILGTLEESLSLLRRSFEAGKSSWLDVLVTRRTLFDARRDLVRIATETRRAGIRLDLAAGRMPLPGGEGP